MVICRRVINRRRPVVNETNRLEEIGLQSAIMANMVRDLIGAELLDWQKVPYLALQAEGYPYFGSTVLYELGLWRPHTGNPQEPYIPLVDCATGGLVVVGPRHSQFSAASDAVVLRLITSNLLVQYNPKVIATSCLDRATKASTYMPTNYLTRKRADLLAAYTHIPQVFTRPQKAA